MDDPKELGVPKIKSKEEVDKEPLLPGGEERGNYSSTQNKQKVKTLELDKAIKNCDELFELSTRSTAENSSNKKKRKTPKKI